MARKKTKFNLYKDTKKVEINISSSLCKVINTVHPLYISKFLLQTGQDILDKEWKKLMWDLCYNNLLTDEDISLLMIEEHSAVHSWAYYAREGLGMNERNRPLWESDSNIFSKVSFKCWWQEKEERRCPVEISFRISIDVLDDDDGFSRKKNNEVFRECIKRKYPKISAKEKKLIETKEIENQMRLKDLEIKFLKDRIDKLEKENV